MHANFKERKDLKNKVQIQGPSTNLRQILIL